MKSSVLVVSITYLGILFIEYFKDILGTRYYELSMAVLIGALVPVSIGLIIRLFYDKRVISGLILALILKLSGFLLLESREIYNKDLFGVFFISTLMLTVILNIRYNPYSSPD